MNESMSALVARYTRLIIRELQGKSLDQSPAGLEAGILPTYQEPPIDVPDLSARSNPNRSETIEVDMSAAEWVGEGTWIFPDIPSESDSSWHIFLKDETRAHTAFAPFATISGESTAERFVDQAYRYILMREVDPVGRELYPPLLQNGQLSKRDLLKILADSEEARLRGLKTIMIPDPSSWLGVLKKGQPLPFITYRITD